MVKLLTPATRNSALTPWRMWDDNFDNMMERFFQPTRLLDEENGRQPDPAHGRGGT